MKLQFDIVVELIKRKRRPNFILISVFQLFLSVSAHATIQCAAYCLDVKTYHNPKTSEVEREFNRSPYLRAPHFQGLIAKCKSNFGTALFSSFRYKKTRNSSSKLLEYKTAKAQTACKNI